MLIKYDYKLNHRLTLQIKGNWICLPGSFSVDVTYPAHVAYKCHELLYNVLTTHIHSTTHKHNLPCPSGQLPEDRFVL